MPSSKHLVHPELVPGLEAFPAYPAFDLDTASLAAFRAAPLRQAPPTPDVPVEVSAPMAPGLNGAPDVKVLLYRPKGISRPRPAILHIHGGGYVLGSAEMSDAANRQLAHDLDCVIASVDYRLAPETSFPGNVEDCYAGLKWLHGAAAELESIQLASPSRGRAPAAAWPPAWRSWLATAARSRSASSCWSTR